MNIEEITKKLSILIDENPKKAIEEARKLGDTYNENYVKSKTLIDAGMDTKDANAISEGIEIIRKIMDEIPDNRLYLNYNLGNGLHTLALCSAGNTFDWYLDTHDIRQEARYAFNLVRSEKYFNSELKTQASTNFGNILNSSYRWVEAFDAYMYALEIEASNGVASSGAIKILNHCLHQGIGDENPIRSEQCRLAEITRNSKDTILKFTGPKALEQIEEMIKDYPKYEKKESYEPKDSYEKFVIKNNLTLSPNIKSEYIDLKRWDNLTIKSCIVSVDAEYTVPTIFAMLNVMKADYALARLLFFRAIHEEVQDTCYYSDTLDYACYGTKSSLLILAQRCALDLLDKIAVATLDYLEIEGARKATFKTAWFSKEKKDNLEWRQEIDASIKAGNKPLIALSEIALDLSTTQGFLKTKSDVRNASTHRFVVLHDLGVGHFSKSDCVEHYDIEEFKIVTLETLKLARAALIYFVELIQSNESKKMSEISEVIFPITVPSHHYVRGEE